MTTLLTLVFGSAFLFYLICFIWIVKLGIQRKLGNPDGMARNISLSRINRMLTMPEYVPFRKDILTLKQLFRLRLFFLYAGILLFIIQMISWIQKA